MKIMLLLFVLALALILLISSFFTKGDNSVGADLESTKVEPVHISVSQEEMSAKYGEYIQITPAKQLITTEGEKVESKVSDSITGNVTVSTLKDENGWGYEVRTETETEEKIELYRGGVLVNTKIYTKNATTTP